VRYALDLESLQTLEIGRLPGAGARGPFFACVPSQSSVSRGSPWPATACPTITKRTRWEISALKNSVQSRLSSIFTEPDPPQPFHFRDSFLEGHRRHVISIELAGLGETIRRSQNTLDHQWSIACYRDVDGTRQR
jgi:hypothetical protein